MRTSRPHALVLLVLALAAATLAGCTAEPRGDGAPEGYVSVPDDQLFAAVEALPRVRAADLGHVDRLGESNTYRAVVELEPGLRRPQVVEAFDQVVEILRHGRWNAATIVTVTSGEVVEQDGGHDLFTADDYEQFYGPQTGQEGWPPSFVPGG